MQKYTEHCDLCKKEFNNDKNGFCIEIGYSKGGWGSRQDFIPKRAMDVCTNCFKQLEEKAIHMDGLIRELRK
jgi:hypothetical protein